MYSSQNQRVLLPVAGNVADAMGKVAMSMWLDAGTLERPGRRERKTKRSNWCPFGPKTTFLLRGTLVDISMVLSFLQYFENVENAKKKSEF